MIRRTAGIGEKTYRNTPRTLRVNVTLGLTTTTTVRVVHGVHSQTTDGRADVQPARTTSLTQLSVVVIGVAGDTNSRTAILVNEASLTTRQADSDVLSQALLLLLLAQSQGLLLLFGLIGLNLLLPGVATLGDYGGICTSTSAQLAALVGPQSNIEDESADGNHVQRKAVSTPGSSRSQHTRVDSPAHTLPQVVGNTGHVALHNVSSPHTIRRKDIAQLGSLLAPNQGNVCATTWVVLDPLHKMGPSVCPHEIHHPYPTLVTTTMMADCDAAAIVTATLGVTTLGECQSVDRTAFPEVIVDWSPQVSYTGGTRRVCAELDPGVVAGRRRSKGSAEVGCRCGHLVGRRLQFINDSRKTAHRKSRNRR